MKHVVFDAETDGLLDTLTTVHSLVLRDLETDAVVSCANNVPGYRSIEEGLSLLSEAKRAYGHNAIGFDLPAIRKVYPGFTLKGKLMDTLITAQMRWAHIRESDFALNQKNILPGRLIGSHALEAWGFRLGVHKGTFKKEQGPEGFKVWTPEMQSYCEQDTVVTKALIHRIRAAGVSSESVETEHELAFYLTQQERNGWPFNVEGAVALQAKLAAKRQVVDQELRTLFAPWTVSLGMFTPKVNSKKFGYTKGVPVERFKTVEFNPASRDNIANRLTALYGWTPTEFTNSGKPEVNENTLKGLNYPPVVRLREYLLLDKRLGQIAEGKEAWLHHHTDQGPEGGKLTGLFHIHGRVKQNHAITSRASHSSPNVGQVPKVGNPYGEECRSLWYAGPNGWVQMGVDASGLELRCLAHYMAKYDNGVYGKLLLEGDVHSLTQRALAEWVDEGKKGRDTSKTWKYAWLYGAGDEKLGEIIIKGATEILLPSLKKYTVSTESLKQLGRRSREMFLKTLPALKYLVDAVRFSAIKKGYLLLIDGRRAYIRSEHAALNTLLQGTGAVICKRWIVEYNRRLCREFNTPAGGGWLHPWTSLGWIHDEVQLAGRTQFAEPVANIVVDSIRAMTSHFLFRCPLDGAYKLGANWAECH